MLTSCFAANYVRWWGDVMGPGRPLRATPVFDGRAVCYPNAATLRDYLSWRQADCHINNQVGRRLPPSRQPPRGHTAALPGVIAQCRHPPFSPGSSCHHPGLLPTPANPQYNTPYWELVKSGVAPAEAQATLAGTDAGFKNELLFTRFGINYNELPAQFRKARRGFSFGREWRTGRLAFGGGAAPGPHRGGRTCAVRVCPAPFSNPLSLV